MAETRVSLTDLRQNLAELVNRAAYGRERIVLVSHGEPKAVIIGVEELRSLEQRSAEFGAQGDPYARALEAADLVREQARRWQAEHGIVAEDAVETLGLLREEHDNDLGGLR